MSYSLAEINAEVDAEVDGEVDRFELAATTFAPP